MTLSLFKYRQQTTEGTVKVTKYRNCSEFKFCIWPFRQLMSHQHRSNQNIWKTKYHKMLNGWEQISKTQKISFSKGPGEWASWPEKWASWPEKWATCLGGDLTWYQQNKGTMYAKHSKAKHYKHTQNNEIQWSSAIQILCQYFGMYGNISWQHMSQNGKMCNFSPKYSQVCVYNGVK